MTSAEAVTTTIRLILTNNFFRKQTFNFIVDLIWNCARSTIRSEAIFGCLRHIDFVGVGWNENGDSRFPGGAGFGGVPARFGTDNRAPWPHVRVFEPPVGNGRHLPRRALRPWLWPRGITPFAPPPRREGIQPRGGYRQ